MELRAAAHEARRLQQERDEIARREHWEQAVADAKTAAIEHHRAQTLQQQVERWLECRDLDAYLDALERAVAGKTGDDRAHAAQWLAWARDFRTRRVPLNADLRIPKPPELTADTLRPFLGGLSPYGP